MKNLAMAYSMKKRAKKKFAEGGEAASKTGYGLKDMAQKGVHHQTAKHQAGVSTVGGAIRRGDHELVKNIHREKLADLKSMKKPNLMADGGFVEEEEDSGYLPLPEEHEKMNHAAIAEDADMIARIMHQRYSRGGQVANDVGVAEADEEPAEYDDLVLRDDLDGSQPEDSNEHGDSAVSDDLIDRIMLKKKKERMPRPA